MTLPGQWHRPCPTPCPPPCPRQWRGQWRGVLDVGPADHTRKAERRYAADLADGQVPSLRAVMADLQRRPGQGPGGPGTPRQPRDGQRGGVMTDNMHAELAELDGEIVDGVIVDDEAAVSRPPSVV